MQRHIFLIPGFFGFANLGDFAYWGPVSEELETLLNDAGVSAKVHGVKSLPTASLRTRTRVLLETIAAARPGPKAKIHLIGHSTGGLDARLMLTPAVDLQSKIDVEKIAGRVCSSVSVATPHRGAPIASFFTSLLGHKLLRLLSLATMGALRTGQVPLSAWAKMAGLFALPNSLDGATGSLASQLYRQLLSDFNLERRAQVEELLGEVNRDQSLLTQLTIESMDVFNAAAGDRDGVSYGSLVTWAKPASLASAREIGLDPIDQAQLAFYYSLSRLATGYDFPAPDTAYSKVLRTHFGEAPDLSASDGIVPTLSQPWGECIAVAQADHLDIIGHHGGGEGDSRQHYDWLTTRSNFREADFDDVWSAVVRFMLESER